MSTTSAYSRATTSQAFNQSIGTDGSVGIWHEAYLAQPGSYENVYANMPAFGLGKASALLEARSGLQSAAGRLRGTGLN